MIADRRDIDFVIHEQFRLSDLSQNNIFCDFTKKIIDMIITEARNLAIKEILPTQKIGDEKGCSFRNGKVLMPAGFKNAWCQLGKGEWFAPSQGPEWGGQGIPQTLNVMAQNYLIGANLSLLMIAGLNNGVGKILESFGNEQQKKKFIKKLYSGEWSGTMMLTEADAGSNLGELETTAINNGDSTYSLVGTKVFISGGDHDMTDNIVHMVLARIEGAPSKSRGISLFLVPKYQVNEDGSIGDFNDVVCTGIEEKMGLHGSPTCTMALGSKGKCIGTLIGEENKGLSIMFLMMNHARLLVGSQGLALASSAYMHALQYARQRIQGIPPGSKDGKQTSLINHPDIKRMLLKMKAYTEGSRSIIAYIAFLEDSIRISSDDDKENLKDMIDFLTPVGKGYVTDQSVKVCNLAIQIFGGYGYTKEFPVEQIFRDVRVTTIYEGTNGIQAMDFLGRKISMKDGRTFEILISKIEETISDTLKIKSLSNLSGLLKSALYRFTQSKEQICQSVKGQNTNNAYAFASLFLEVTGDIMMAWMLLWRAVLACKLLDNEPNKRDIIFYKGQISSATFFIQSMLPVTMGKIDSINDMSDAVTNISDAGFGGH